MTIACTFNPTTQQGLDGTVTISFTGLAATTTYAVAIGSPNTRAATIISDGSGNATLTWVPQGGGSHPVNVSLVTTSLAGTFWAGAKN